MDWFRVFVEVWFSIVFSFVGAIICKTRNEDTKFMDAFIALLILFLGTVLIINTGVFIGEWIKG